MKYAELLKEVTSAYSGADVVDMISKGSPIKKFTMQYEETDWQFLKRMASRFHTGLIPAAVFDKPKFSFGVPEGEYKGKIDDFHYRVRKKIADFRSFSENDPKKIEERDFVYYEVETDTVLDIGNEVDFKGKRLFVCEAHTQMENSLLKHQYVLCPKEGMSQKTMYHEGIVGLTLEGKVIDVAADTVKVHLEIDKKQGVEKAHWFPYSSMYTAEGHSGWYCMPELHDSVHLYFPSHKEEECVAINSIRKDATVTGENKLGNPSHKYFRTADGKEIRLSPDEIVITAKDGETFIRLHEKEGIEVYSKKNIQIISDDTITMSAQKKMILSAKGEISITCKESKIKMDGTTTITGKKLKTN
ncbi:hypothetical protein DFP93_11398 [Aneurinibacillus soli]|uniref:Uncharacterized protein n=1 Tax=Aneurinibacillus soli TaxID=1500254 RepID=A0A0U5B8F1_9BACL|nr:hypothetical protein [Aneurinibacillus soli]PYE60388.1 hypothetical protein DFP93_11398 [Aneurinibacillus soli]BAU27212.1 hypothetical protein CB4_01381 [Aneurinibacillus soli]